MELVVFLLNINISILVKTCFEFYARKLKKTLVLIIDLDDGEDDNE